jgi:hypothetical protein
MYLCDNFHDEVCYESHPCPVCEYKTEIERLQLEIESLRDQVKELLEDRQS